MRKCRNRWNKLPKGRRERMWKRATKSGRIIVKYVFAHREYDRDAPIILFKRQASSV